ncbi:MAG TPA: alpha/beta hydrolase [Candidatus Anoxymicrobiaceae bacterium]
MGWVIGLIIVGVCAVVIGFLVIPSSIRQSDRRRESRRGKREPRSITDGKKKEGACSLDGTPLYVDYLGDSDPTILFVHGILSNGQVFRYQKPFFAEKYRVVSLDLRGHGRSSLPRRGDFCIDRMAEDIKAVIDAFNPKQFIVAGHSMGGFATFKFYEKFSKEYEGRLKGLAILDSTGADTTDFSLRWKFGALYLKYLLDNSITELLKKRFANSGFMYLYGRWLAFGKKAPASEVDFLNGIGSEIPIKTMKGAAKACLDHRFEYCLPSVDVPVMMLVGSEDSLMAKDRLNSRTCALLPDARLKVIEGAGHNAMLELPDEVNQSLDAFFMERFGGGRAFAGEDAPAPGANRSQDQLVPEAP